MFPSTQSYCVLGNLTAPFHRTITKVKDMMRLTMTKGVPHEFRN